MNSVIEYPFLGNVGEKPLRDLVGTVVTELPERSIAELDREDLYSVLFALFGYEVLKSSEVRKLVLLSLSEERLRAIGEQFGIPGHTKPFDIAIRLSNLPWRAGTKLVQVLAEEVSVSDEYLPGSNQHDAATEFVEPSWPLPQLLDYQVEMAGEVAGFLAEEESGAALLQLPTGAGKTRVTLEGICRYLRRTASESRTILWMAHTEELCDQAAESFLRMWKVGGSHTVRLVRVWDGYHPSLREMRAAVVVAGYRKLTSLFERERRGVQALLSATAVVIVDEAHKALAPTVREVLKDARALGVKVLGLTATPGRGQDETLENRKLANLFDRRLLTSKELGKFPISKLRELGVLAHVRRRVLRSGVLVRGASDAELLDDISPKVLAKLAVSEPRNELIVDSTIEQVKAGHQTLVFCCTVEHARALAVAAAMRSTRATFLDYTMGRERRRSIVNAFRNGTVNALFNYGVLSTGFDAPNTECVIIARPTSSIVLYSQMVGRGLRGPAVGGSETFLLIDVEDNFESFGEVEDVYSHFESFWRTTETPASS